MIIKELELINFGKFNNKTVRFEKGMNIIYGENEAGKTTLHTFIRGMLFGIEKQRGKASANDIYSKYEPWDDPTNYQGKMRIEQNGKNYRIERFFNKNNKRFAVIDEDEGRELTEEEIEKLLSGINEACYYNTISISQLGSATSKELEYILKSYAANLGATKSMEIDIKEAFADLDKQRKKIMTDNKVSQEQEVERSLKNAIEKLEISENEQNNIAAGLEQKQTALEGVEAKHKEISTKDEKRLERIAKQNERKDKLYQDALVFTADVEKYSTSLEKVKEHKAEIEEKLQEFKVSSREVLDGLVEKATRKSNFPFLFMILFLASLGAGVGLIVGNLDWNLIRAHWQLPAACFGGAIIFLVAAIIKYFYNKKKKTKNLEKLKEVRQVIEEQETAKHEEIYIERQLANKKEALEKTQIMLKAENDHEEGAEDFSEELKEVREKAMELKEQINRAQWQLEQSQERDIVTQNQIAELKETQANIMDAKREMEAIERAKEEIEEIADEIRNSFGKRLNERASFYMGKITNGKYDNLNIDEKLNITVNGKHSLVAANRLSKGTIEQIYMSLRLGAADIIFEDNEMPILLDDAFAMYDNKRMGNTMRFMSSEMNQVIMFSCHTREKVMADKLGLNYNLITL